MKRILFFLLFSSISGIHAQSSSGPNEPSSSSNNTDIGSISWSNTNNSYTSNNVYTTASAIVVGDISNYLTVSNFGFSVPSTSVVTGVVVEVENSATGLLQNIQYQSIRLVTTGTISGNDNAAGGTWPTSDAMSTFGTSSDSWGLSLTPAIVNSSDFGVAISVKLGGLSVSPTARIDDIKVTVHYSTPLPVTLLNFNADCSDIVTLNWEVNSETNNDYFTIAKSLDGSSYHKVGCVKGKGNSSMLNHYSFVDYSNNDDLDVYYKLLQTDYDGKETHLDIIALNCDEFFSPKVYPNPSNGTLTIAIKDDSNLQDIEFRLMNMTGQIIYANSLTNVDNSLDLTVNGVQNGVYYYFINSGGKTIKKDKLIVR